MTWGNIQIESLKKMFLTNDILEEENIDIYKQDKKYKTYLDAMPQAYNEAVNYIASVCGSFIEAHSLSKDDEHITRYNGNILLDLFGFDENCKKLIKVELNGKIIPFKMKTTNTVLIEYNGKEDLLLYIEEEPTHFNSSSKIEETTNLPEKLVRLIPLYIAGELYKDDDNSMATMYMNEFLTNLDIFAKEINPIIQPTFTSIYNIYEV